MKTKLIATLFIVCVLFTGIMGKVSEVKANSNTPDGDLIMSPSPSTYAYSIGGINEDGHDFTPNVNYSYNLFNNMVSVTSAYKSTSPTLDYISGNNPGGYKRLGSKIVLLTGHANYEHISLDNENGKVGVYRDGSCTGSNGRQYYGLNNVSMSHTDLIMFFGCKTAYGNSNLCTKSVTKGAKAAVGTTNTVVSRTGQGATWVKRFLDGLYNGKTIIQAGAYANTFVDAGCSMRKYWTYKGNGSTVVNSGGASKSTERSVTNGVVEEETSIPFYVTEREIENESALDYEDKLKDVLHYLTDIDSSFCLSDYFLSVKSFGDGVQTVSLAYRIGNNIYTDRGFNFVCEDGTITRVVYNSLYYSQRFLETTDEEQLISLAERDMEKANVALKESKNEVVRAYYSYSYQTGELKHIIESYVFDGVDWIDDYEEEVLN